jgi:lipoprotein-anchoring transpeptidase ErfK/SrfK
MISKQDGDHPTRQNIIVDIPRQVLELHVQGTPIASYPVSTSRFGIGTEEGSFRTPTGRFRICQKIGADSPPWMIFKGRVPTGEIATPGGDEDLVLSRILWLEGLDAHNNNTRDRYIYIHGTNQEEQIGTPASHGCIRLCNLDMIDLYAKIPNHTEVFIRP